MNDTPSSADNTERKERIGCLTATCKAALACLGVADRLSVICSLVVTEAAISPGRRGYFITNLLGLIDTVDAMGDEQDANKAAADAAQFCVKHFASAEVVELQPGVVPELVQPTLNERQDIVRLSDHLNECFRPHGIQVVLSAINTVVLNGYMRLGLQSRREILEDVRLLVRMLEAIGDADDLDEIRRRVESVMPASSVFTGDRPAGTEVH